MVTKRGLTKAYAAEYGRASKTEKGRMLDELTAATGWSRVNARRAIRQASKRRGPVSAVTRKPRPRKYSYDALKVLQEVWVLSGEPCGKYLAAVMGDLLERLVRFNELGRVADRVSEAVLGELLAMSGATIDRYLRSFKAARYPEAKSTTSPSRILRSSIPLRTAMDGFPAVPGYLEIDTVAHCGHTTSGDYLVTICATDPFTGWTVTRTVKNKSFLHMQKGMEWIVRQLPWPLLGVDFDNGSEFLNWGLIAWCERKGIASITRSRPYEHNDNAHVEQRNGAWVRKHAFRYRYETDAEMALLNRLWVDVMDKQNHLLPCVKAVDWAETRSGRKKRVYDSPRTPYRRVLDAAALPDGPKADRLAARHQDLNPAAITRRINQAQNKLIDSARAVTHTRREAA
ncbi:MAG: transposase family protein [Bifidobacteriaceae bacterium]|nr:transposase family protein [Bifidobacteriaceae bacterium]